MNNESSSNNEFLNPKTEFDLEKRTLDFGKAVVQQARIIPENRITRPIISQFIRSGTSVGANYCEANNAQSKADFNHKISICKKESREVMYWLSLLAEVSPDTKSEITVLWQEAKELTLIFGAIVRSSRTKK